MNAFPELFLPGTTFATWAGDFFFGFGCAGRTLEESLSFLSVCLLVDLEACEEVSSQLVPKSTRTLVNSYPFLVNSYLTFGQLVPTPSQLVPESKKRGRVERDRRRIGKSRS